MKKCVAVLMLVMMAVGFDWGLPQRSDIIKITLKNQFSVGVRFYVNDAFACTAAANSSCTVQVNVRKAPFIIEARNFNNKVIASHTFKDLAPGKDIIWATGNIELNPVETPPPTKTVTTPVPPKTSAEPAPPKTVAAPIAQDSVKAKPAAPKSATISFMTSFSTLNYQGQKAQNRAQTASFAKIERQTSSTGATYALSGKGGLRIGQDGKALFYEAPPITVNRNLADRLSSDKRGLSLWLSVINGTLNGLTHKRMASGDWEESIPLSLDDGFPETIQARFRAQPLPEPDSKWILITADSGLISFRALDVKYQDSLIYGRYQGVLVYSPTEDEFLQAAAAFTLYHGEDKFRIEQLHFAADANGKQLYPVLNVGPHLDFKAEAPVIATPGEFPSWCVQAAQVLDILHLTMMTAAEGSTNPSSIMTLVDQSLLNWHTFSAGMEREMAVAKTLLEQSEIVNKYLGAWLKTLTFIETQRREGTAKAMYGLAKDLGKDLIVAAINVLPLGIGQMYQVMELAFTIQQASFDQMDYDLEQMMRAPFSRPAPKPAITGETPPPDEVKEPPASGGGDAALWGLLGALGAAAGAYQLGLFGDGGDDSSGDDTGSSFTIKVTNHSSQNLTSFKVNGTEYGPINAGTSKSFSVAKTGSCTTINYSWKTSLNYSYSDYGKYKTSCGFGFTDNFQSNMAPVCVVALSDCN